MTERTDDLGSRTFAAGRWKLLTVASKVALYILVLAVLARFVLPEEFGIVALANIVIAFATMFSNAGLGPALIQRQHITRTHVRVGFTSGVLLALALWAVIWIAAPTIAAFFREEEVTWVLRIIGGSFVLLSFGLVSRALLERALDFRRLMLADLGSYVGFGIVGVAAAVAGYGVWALVAGTLTQRLVFSAICVWLHPHSILPSLARKELGELLSFGGGLTLSRVFHFLGSYGDKAVAGRLLGAGPLGFYERAYDLMNRPQEQVGNIIDQIMFPALARVQSDRDRLASAFGKALSLANLILLPSSVALVILAPEIVAVVLGPMWEPTVFPLQALGTVMWLKGSMRMCDSLARAVGAVYRSAGRKVVYAVSVLGGAYIGAYYGADGVAIGVGGAIVVAAALMLQLSISILQEPWRYLLPAVGPGLLFSCLTVATIVPTALLLRTVEAPALAVLAVTGVGAVLVNGLFALAFPKLLGSGGLWLMRRTLDSLPGKGPLLDHLRGSGPHE